MFGCKGKVYEVIQAIPTKYDGIEYRSRTEARWAVFFRYLNIDFEYEKEGYQTSKGWYVPDFWLPEENCWIEIKGAVDGHREHMSKLMEVCMATNTYGFVFVGSPRDMKGSFVGQDCTDSSGGVTGSWLDAGFSFAGREVTSTFAIDLGSRDRDFYDANMRQVLENVHSGDFRQDWIGSGVKGAAELASKHRFW